MKQVKITKIELKNFMGFAESVKTFSDNAEIVGASGTGKTTYMQAMRFAFNLPTCDYKPHTHNKALIPELETYVRVDFTVDGVQYFIERKGSQKWKTDKENGLKIYNGYDASSFNFDGTPCKANELDKQLSELFGIQPKYLPLVTISDFFNNQYDWKSRRELLFEKCGVNELTCELKKQDKFNLISNELLKGKDTTEISKILNSEKLSINKQRIATESKLAVRVSDLSNANKYDFEEISSEIEKVNAQIEKLIVSNNKTNKNQIINDKLNEISKIQSTLNKLRQEDMINKQSHDRELNKLEINCRNILNEIDSKTTNNQMFEQRIEHYKNEIETIKTTQFDGDTICPYCKQKLPSSDIDKLVEEFENNKSKQIEDKQSRIETYLKQVSFNNSEIKALKTQYKNFKASFDKLQGETLKTNVEQIKNLENDIENINSEINSLKIASVKVEVEDKIAELKVKQQELQQKLFYKNEIDRLQSEIDKINDEIAELNDCESLNIKKRAQLQQYEMDIIQLANTTIILNSIAICNLGCLKN